MTFAEWWMQVHDEEIDPKDVLRAAEKAWYAGRANLRNEIADSVWEELDSPELSGLGYANRISELIKEVEI